MTPPICCGKRSTAYRKEYGEIKIQSINGAFASRWELIWEEGFRCKRCGKIRLYFPVDGSAYLAELNALRTKLGLDNPENYECV